MNKKPFGGTEQITERLKNSLDWTGVQLIPSRVRELDPDAIRILHLHDTAGDPEAKHLAVASNREKFDALVFVSNHQQEDFYRTLGVPYDSQSRVILNGVDRFYGEPTQNAASALLAFKDKGYYDNKSQTAIPPGESIRLIYTSTPHRGLQLLVPVFEHVYDVCREQGIKIQLDVYSSFEIYGWDVQDKVWMDLFDKCRNHPGINYHGSVSPEEVRAGLRRAHIFAYPCIYQETSCRCLIEAMMAGLWCVHPNYGALTETSGGMTQGAYAWASDPNEHSLNFQKALFEAIAGISKNGGDFWLINEQIGRANRLFAWDNVLPQWQRLLDELRARS